MEDKRYSGYPVYAEDELGMISSVASASEATGLLPTPPASVDEDDSYAGLYSKPKLREPVNNEVQEVRPNKRIF